MAISELTKESLGKTKIGWTWDNRRKVWSTWQVDTIFHGKRHIRRGFKTKQAAKEYLETLEQQEYLKKIGVIQLIDFPRVAELFERHLATKKIKHSHTRAARIFKTFLSVISPNLKLDELKRKHFKDFSDKRLRDGIKAETVSREITELSSAIHAAGDYFPGLESWTVPRNLIYRPPFEPNERDRIITADERQLVIKHLLRGREIIETAKTHFARVRAGLLLHFALLTGLRHGEISALKKSDFDRQARRLRAERFKTKRKGVSVTIFEPLTDVHIDVLDQAAELYPNGAYFFSENGKPHNKYYETMRKQCAMIGVKYGRNIDGGFITHDSRHSFITALEHNSVDSTTTRGFSGHSRDGMMKRYAHATPESRNRAMQLIADEMRLDEKQETDLRGIFEAVRSGAMEFEEFAEIWAK